MAKTIKFNLILDEKPVRNLEELIENFNIQDILEVYENGLLKRWLEARGYEKIVEAISQIDNDKKNIEIVKSFIEIFNIDKNEEEIKEVVYAIELKSEKEEHIRKIKKYSLEFSNVISEYHEGYSKIMDNINNSSSNLPFIKNAIYEIINNYFELFKLDYERILKKYEEFNPMLVLALLMNEKTRDIIINNSTISIFYKNIQEKLSKIIFNEIIETYKLNQKEIYGATVYRGQGTTSSIISSNKLSVMNNSSIFSSLSSINLYNNRSEILVLKEYSALETNNSNNPLIDYSLKQIGYTDYIFIKDIKEIPKNNIKRFKGKTEGYWKDIESKGKKYMIISIENGNFIRSEGNSGEEYDAEKVNGKFLILDGIDYKSNNDSHELIYMEV